MEKGLERATGEEASGTKPRSHQQAVPPPSSVGQEMIQGPATEIIPAAPRQARLAIPAFPLSSLFSPGVSPATELWSARAASCTAQPHIPHPGLQAPQQHANTTPGGFHREQTHRNGGCRAETSDIPTAAAKIVAVSQFAREVFKNAENSPDTEFPALST